MLRLLLLLLVLLLGGVARGQDGETAANSDSDSPFEVDVTLIHDFAALVSGGLERGTGTARMYDVAVTVDLEPFLGEDAGTVAAEWYSLGGSGISPMAGDLLGVSNIASERRNVFAEFWWERWFLDERMRMKLGKVDANCEFAFSEVAADFLNCSMGCSPTIVGMPAFPDPAWSVNLEWRPSADFSTRVGIYDGATQAGIATGDHGPSTFLGAPSDLFLIGQVDAGWEAGGGGRLGLGLSRHTGTFDRFDGGTQQDADGAFLVLDQNLWRESSPAHDATGAFSDDRREGCRVSVGQAMGGDGEGERLDMYVQLGLTDDRVSEISRHVGTGLRWSGFAPDHTLALGVTRAELSDRAGAGFSADHETAVELTWLWEANESLTIQPDVQFIMNPGGDKTVADALVVGCRAVWRF